MIDEGTKRHIRICRRIEQRVDIYIYIYIYSGVDMFAHRTHGSQHNRPIYDRRTPLRWPLPIVTVNCRLADARCLGDEVTWLRSGATAYTVGGSKLYGRPKVSEWERERERESVKKHLSFLEQTWKFQSVLNRPYVILYLLCLNLHDVTSSIWSCVFRFLRVHWPPVEIWFSTSMILSNNPKVVKLLI